MDDFCIDKLIKQSLCIKKDLLLLCSKKGIHIGGDLSVCDMMTVLWQYKLRYDPNNTSSIDRDRFILSKGHAAAVMSLNQAYLGCFSKEEFFNEYATNEGRFSMHSCKLVNPYVEVSTGSLGHGLSIATGIATGIRRKNNNTSRVYVVMGDGELSEGSVWEAAMHAAHYKLGNLIAIVDNNGLGADGSIDELTGLGNVSNKFQSFGWNVIDINGHQIKEIVGAFDALPSPSSFVPTVVIGKTVKGNGVSFMRNNVNWHAGKITESQYIQALKEVEEQMVIDNEL